MEDDETTQKATWFDRLLAHFRSVPMTIGDADEDVQERALRNLNGGGLVEFDATRALIGQMSTTSDWSADE